MIIADIKPDMVGVRVTATVKSVGTTRTVKTKFGSEVKVADAIIADESGEAKLTLWAEQIEKVKPGDTVQIIEGMAREWQGQIQISVGRRGELKVNPTE
jgi:ssDNA-binding replication factor A large subunit